MAKEYDLVIAGAGPAGLMVSRITSKSGLKVLLVEQKKVGTREAVSALREQKRFGQPVVLQLKVDTGKLDKLVDLVEELAIIHSVLRQNEMIRTSSDGELNNIINQLIQITSELQRTTMSLRMVPVKNTFHKMFFEQIGKNNIKPKKPKKKG